MLCLYLHFIVLFLLKRITWKHSTDVAAMKTCHNPVRKCLVSKCHLIKTIQTVGEKTRFYGNCIEIKDMLLFLNCCVTGEPVFVLPVALMGGSMSGNGWGLWKNILVNITIKHLPSVQTAQNWLGGVCGGDCAWRSTLVPSAIGFRMEGEKNQ